MTPQPDAGESAVPPGGRRRRVWGRWLRRGALGLGGCGLVAVAVSPPLAVRAALAPRFSTERWAATPPGSGARHRMLPDLIYRHRLVGLTPDEAVHLLGPPTRRDIGPLGWGWLVYFLGYDSGFFDSWYDSHLILRVEDGRVRRVEQVLPWIDGFARVSVRQE